MVRDDLEGAPPLALLVLPGMAAEPPVDGDASPFREVDRAGLGLLAPGGDAHEVGATVRAPPIDREEKVRDLLLLAELSQLDVGSKVPNQRHDVHAEEASAPQLT